MKVKLYESQLNRTDLTGSRPLTAQVNPNLFAQLGGAATNIGKAITNLGVQKLKYDQANEKLDNRNKATLAVTAFKEEVDTVLREIKRTADPTTAYDTGPKTIVKIFNKYKDAYSDNKKVQQLFMLDASIIGIDKKNKFLDEFLEKKIQLGEANVAQRVTNHLDIAVDSGNELNNRLNAATNAEEELKIAKDNFVLSDIKYKEEVSKFNYNMVENTIASLMYGSNSPDLIAQAIEDEDFLQGQGDAQDLILSKYYKKLTSDQKIKVQEYANKKADSIMKADAARVKRDETEIDKNIDTLKKQFINSEDNAEKLIIHNQLINANGYKTIKERNDFEKELNATTGDNANSIIFADKDDETKLGQFWQEERLGNVSQADLLDPLRFGGSFTYKTFVSLKKHLNTDIKEDEALALTELKNEMEIADGYEEAFETSVVSSIFTTARPYLAEFAAFRRTNPSKKELEDKVKDIASRYNAAKKTLFGQEYVIELENIKNRLKNNGYVKKAIEDGLWDFSKYENNPTLSLAELISVLQNVSNASGFINSLTDEINVIKGFQRITQ